MHSKRILIGITGGIAAYKVLELIRRLKQSGAHIKVILTAAGKEFVTPLSIQALSGEKIYDSLLDPENESAMSHIDLARWAEVMLIAPATANFIGKCAYGLADDLLSTVCLTTTAPILLAPAMNQQMWQNSATQHNIELIRQRGVTILGPAIGSQACGEFGPGRMLEAEQLLEHLTVHFAAKKLTHKHILLTAGPTREAIDPIRYLSNHSSGKMGYALAQAALKLGAKVTLISGPTNLHIQQHSMLDIIKVVSAQDMLQAVLQTINSTKVDIFIGCAAVADYRPAQTHTQKLKKNAEHVTLTLQRTADILSAVAKLPANLRPFTVGFAAETENLLANAQAKLQNKCLDLLIANAVENGQVFNQDENKVFILRKNTETIELPKMHKDILAYRLLEEMVLEG